MEMLMKTAAGLSRLFFITACILACPGNAFSREIDLKVHAEANLGCPIGQLRAVPVSIGAEYPHAVALLYSEESEVDPWEGMFFFPEHTLKLAVMTSSGELLWKRDLGKGVVPGIWFSPLFAFDLNRDGTDEIWIINNLDPAHPLNYRHYVLQQLDPLTGEKEAELPWKKPAVPQELSHLYRHFIMGGYVKGEPVLLTAQGTYGPMRIQAWNSDLSLRWEHVLPDDAPGALGSHVSPVVDIDSDGIDDLLWGERCIELDGGSELFCADKQSWEGHSDIVQPVYDYDNKAWYIFTCRESFNDLAPRLAVFDQNGDRIWADLDHGHMDTGWAARLGDEGEAYVLGVRIGMKTRTAEGESRTEVEEFTYKAFTGEKAALGFDLYTTLPVDLNGDGIHELVKGYFEGNGDVIDRKGRILGNIGGLSAMASKFTSLPGEQILSYSKSGFVRIWADVNARDNERALKRYANPYYQVNRIQTGNGYNLFSLGGI